MTVTSTNHFAGNDHIEYEYKINRKDRCMIMVRPVGSKYGFNVYGTFNTPVQALRVFSMLGGLKLKDEDE